MEFNIRMNMLRIPWLVVKKILPWCNFILMRQKLGLGLCMYWMLVVCQSDGAGAINAFVSFTSTGSYFATDDDK